MFRMSKKIDYAVLSVAHLCQSETRSASAKEIATHFGISVSFVANILKQLTRAGVLNSVRGVMGGYELARSPEEISVGDLIRALEGEFYFADCTHPHGEVVCNIQDCPVRNPIHEIHRKFVSILNTTSFAELLGLDGHRPVVGAGSRKASWGAGDP
ncbi:Rrf2 family transcriptional regulator [bacterium]|nr:Rrf2 family transcriptional regulator [bacterium]